MISFIFIMNRITSDCIWIYIPLRIFYKNKLNKNWKRLRNDVYLIQNYLIDFDLKKSLGGIFRWILFEYKTGFNFLVCSINASKLLI